MSTSVHSFILVENVSNSVAEHTLTTFIDYYFRHQCMYYITRGPRGQQTGSSCGVPQYTAAVLSVVLRD